MKSGSLSKKLLFLVKREHEELKNTQNRVKEHAACLLESNCKLNRSSLQIPWMAASEECLGV